MTRSETARIVGKALDFTGREPSPEKVTAMSEAWHECIGHLPFEETMRAVTTWYKTSDRQVMPADLIEIVAPVPGWLQ